MITRGFTLIELIISLAIAAIVSVSLTMLLQQSYASQKKLESLTHLYSRAALVFTQLERDLMGATIPIENILAMEDESKKKGDKNKKEQASTEQQAAQAAPNEKAQTAEKKESGEVPYKAIEKVFYYAHTERTLNFSWITRDPLQLYWGSSVGTARPRIARIMYRLEPDPNDKTLFKLMRSEGSDLTYAPYEKHTDPKYKGSMIANGIKKLTITCFAIQEKQEENKIPDAKAGEEKKAEKIKPPVLEVKKLDTWEWPRSDKEKKENEAKDKNKPELPPLPQGIRIELVLWDAAREREVTFESAIAIPAIPSLKRETTPQQSQPQQEKQPEQNQPPAPNNRGGGQSTVGGISGMPQGVPLPTGSFGGIVQADGPRSMWSSAGKPQFSQSQPTWLTGLPEVRS